MPPTNPFNAYALPWREGSMPCRMDTCDIIEKCTAGTQTVNESLHCCDISMHPIGEMMAEWFQSDNRKIFGDVRQWKQHGGEMEESIINAMSQCLSSETQDRCHVVMWFKKKKEGKKGTAMLGDLLWVHTVDWMWSKWLILAPCSTWRSPWNALYLDVV